MGSQVFAKQPSFRQRGPLLLALRCGVVALGISLAPLSWAQGANDKAAAEALFDEGVKLLKDGKYEEACRKLETSQRVDPGIGTLLYLGECYKKAGRTASAWATFREAASKAEAAGETERARAGAKRANEIEPSLSKVTLSMSEESMEIEGLVVKLGNLPVNRALWGTAVPVDPGELKVVVEAPGYESWETTITVEGAGSAQTLTVPALQKLPESLVQDPEEEEPQTMSSSEQPEVRKKGSGQRAAGLAVGGLGVVGVGLGSAFGILAMQAENDAGEFCEGAVCEAGSDGVSLTNKARGRATVSTIGFIAGGALLATGLTLYFTAKSGGEATALTVHPKAGGGFLSLKAGF